MGCRASQRHQILQRHLRVSLPQGRVKVGNIRSDLRRWSTLAPVRRLSLPYGSLPARSAPPFRPGQRGLAVRCAGQHGHVDSFPHLVLGAFTQLRCQHDDFDAALVAAGID